MSSPKKAIGEGGTQTLPNVVSGGTAGDGTQALKTKEKVLVQDILAGHQGSAAPETPATPHASKEVEIASLLAADKAVFEQMQGEFIAHKADFATKAPGLSGQVFWCKDDAQARITEKGEFFIDTFEKGQLVSKKAAFLTDIQTSAILPVLKKWTIEAISLERPGRSGKENSKTGQPFMTVAQIREHRGEYVADGDKEEGEVSVAYLSIIPETGSIMFKWRYHPGLDYSPEKAVAAWRAHGEQAAKAADDTEGILRDSLDFRKHQGLVNHLRVWGTQLKTFEGAATIRLPLRQKITEGIKTFLDYQESVLNRGAEWTFDKFNKWF